MGVGIGEQTNTFAVICKTVSGEVYQVCLTEDEMTHVRALISHLHGGKVRCLETPLDFIELETPAEAPHA